jgi:hypothetical protein
MFWRRKATVDADTAAWIIECWQWLDETIPPDEDKPQPELILPSRKRFPETDKQGHERAVHYFDLVRSHCGMSNWHCELVAQEERPEIGSSAVFGGSVPGGAAPLGTFQASGNAAIITYDPAMLGDPIQLIATLAHELSHYLMLGRSAEPPGGAELLECATDLTTVYLGFGLFGANTAFNFRQHTDFDRQGWSFSRAGYLGEPEWCFANAVFMELLGVEEAEYADYAKASVFTQINKNRAYLKANPAILEGLRLAQPIGPAR